MNDVIVRNVRLNTDDPKICNAIMGVTREAIVEEVKILSELGTDLFEWRADTYEHFPVKEEMQKTMEKLRRSAKQKPVIFSVRGAASGGTRLLSAKEQATACRLALESGCMDLIEVELAFGEELFGPLIAEAKKRGVKTILSYYDYEKTPDQWEILDALSRCESYGADLSKIAVTAKTKRDLLSLWSGMVEREDRSGVRPRIVVAMGPLGNVSRILPSFFGSVLTYASGITTSMEGQINANDLRTILSLI
ncbi:type I 3-dehydroquinate dehydratase [Cuneatibacter sp. NSJ-177]|uniref:type I 3-dehydroquinate dehydratase n=1 Tax=Cuneatibacter sp. NSJ-177 TaxID=2931401 RepID=UPI001FD5BF37|nr:type I 3-dehydroquinate dehydratase [Cuneatibacter sp. NSJ-177]MCJ7837387.1 type I 3-dehydroquinate dehydratase [Cuneatibacter sp. NSJ-177]